jgi:hypothetical protein
MMWTNSLTQQDEIVFHLPTPAPSEPSDDEDEGIHVRYGTSSSAVLVGR